MQYLHSKKNSEVEYNFFYNYNVDFGIFKSFNLFYYLNFD